jgi:hypothetical protein
MIYIPNQYRYVYFSSLKEANKVCKHLSKLFPDKEFVAIPFTPHTFESFFNSQEGELKA